VSYLQLYSAKIIQVLPATGYLALMADEFWQKNKLDSAAFTEPIVCWALVEHVDKAREVVGMTTEFESASLQFPATLSNFSSYVLASTSRGELHRMALEFLENKKTIDEVTVKRANKAVQTEAANAQ
jgi:hypothetical protein